MNSHCFLESAEATDHMNLEECRIFAEKLARDAGPILMGSFRSSNMSVSMKSVSDLVTNADRESEEYLVNRIRSRYPDHTIVAEEGSRIEGPKEYIWFLDPLDGTNNFAHGIPVFSLSLGLYSRKTGKVMVGVVYDPVHHELFSAARGTGAFLNSREITVSSTVTLETSILATGFPYDKKSNDNNIREFSRLVPLTRGIRRMGSAAIDLCYVATGRFDGYWESQIKAWDVAAGSLIVEEAGGRVSTYNGGGFQPEFPQILASNGRIHESLIDILTCG